jgi:hypothetical protein
MNGTKYTPTPSFKKKTLPPLCADGPRASEGKKPDVEAQESTHGQRVLVPVKSPGRNRLIHCILITFLVCALIGALSGVLGFWVSKSEYKAQAFSVKSNEDFRSYSESDLVELGDKARMAMFISLGSDFRGKIEIEGFKEGVSNSGIIIFCRMYSADSEEDVGLLKQMFKTGYLHSKTGVLMILISAFLCPVKSLRFWKSNTA